MLKRRWITGNRSSIDEGSMAGPEDDGTVVEPEQGNVLSHIIAQLRPGADLSRVTLPTFILEPRSMLERITNFMAHPETLLPMSEIDDPIERFVSVVRFYLSGWHIKPPGVKKPLNPILGEIFTCYWEYPDNTKGYYISEQTSHHPPKSSYFFMAPEHHIQIDGCLKPRSKFLGNSAASMMEGIAILRLLNRGEGPRGERYFLTQPNMYARGILFGKMKYELGDHSIVRCPELGLLADIEFKTKGYFSGTYNAIGGTIRNEHTGEILYELSGMWNAEIYIKDIATGKKDLLFDALHSKPTPPIVRPLEEQSERESQKLWYRTAQAVIARDHELATDEKSAIEVTQREEAAKRAADEVEWHPRYFRPVRGGPGGTEEGEEDLNWILNAHIDGPTPADQVKQILAVAPILRGQTYHERMPIPPHRMSRQSLESIRSGKSHKSHAEFHSHSETSHHSPGPEVPHTNKNDLSQSKFNSNTETPHVSPGPQASHTNENDVSQANFHLNTETSHISPIPQAPHANEDHPIDRNRHDESSVAPVAPAAPPSEQSTPVPLPSDLRAVQTENNGQAEKELELTLEDTSTSNEKTVGESGALHDFRKDLSSPNPASPPVKRADSDTKSIDEFVDAEG